jgi:hypothetical protein
MEPVNNNQPQPVVDSAPAQVPVSSLNPVPQQEEVPIQKARSKTLLYGALIGLIAIVTVGVAGAYSMYVRQSNNKMVSAPTPTPVVEISPTDSPAEVSSIKTVGDLDKAVIGISKDDDSLDDDLAELEKDSSF